MSNEPGKFVFSLVLFFSFFSVFFLFSFQQFLVGLFMLIVQGLLSIWYSFWILFMLKFIFKYLRFWLSVPHLPCVIFIQLSSLYVRMCRFLFLYFLLYFGLVSVGIYLTCVSQVFPLCCKYQIATEHTQRVVYVQLLSGPNICLHALVLPVSMFAFVCGLIFPCRLIS